MKTSMFFAAALAGLMSLSATAQNAAPKIVVPVPGESTIISKISDNGLWGVSEKASTTDGDLRPKGGTLFNLSTMEKIYINHSSGLAGVSDVTDDGSIVVGECIQKPAYWTRTSDSWTMLPVPDGFNLGRINAVTPDGRYAAGYLSSTDNEFAAYPVLYDLTTNKQIDLPNIPAFDMQHQDMDQNVFYSISADGRYLLGYMSMSYVLPPHVCVYVYDRQDDTYDFIGFTPDDVKPWTPDVPGTFFIAAPSMSNDGRWVTGQAYMVTEIAGTNWPMESSNPFRYDVVNKKTEILTSTEAAATIGFSISNDGYMNCASYGANPYSTAYFPKGKYLVSLEQIFRQVYGLEFQDQSTFVNSGKPLGMSDDGLTILMMPTPDDTYLLRLAEPISEVAAKVNLLSDYTPIPTAGADLSKLNTITLSFEREVAVKGNSSKITFKSEDGKTSYNPVSSNGFVADGKNVTITFRNRDLEKGTKYTLNIPAGMITLKGDADVTAPEINIPYVGRSNEPVQLLEAVPADGATVPYIDLNGNPVVLKFDTDIRVSDSAKSELFVNDDESALTTLGIIAGGKQAIVYPPVRQNLRDGNSYTIVISEGAFTDISGGGPSKEIVLHYEGNWTYVPDANDKYIFSSDCGTTDAFLFYEGDHNPPMSFVAEWGFNQDTTPWYYTRDDESADMALASHSMYTNFGKSDDWMVTTQIPVPDEKCYLEFDAQSYSYDTEDYLKIYIYSAQEVYNTLDGATVEKFRKDGDLVFNERLSPGKEQDILAGDWTHYTVRLDKYAGQEIYIAFVNENQDQSVIFLDNINVVHDMAFLTAIETPVRVVNADEAVIKGVVSIPSEIDSFDAISMRLLDADKNIISSINESGISISKDNPYKFSFPEALQLKKSEVNKYYVEVTLGTSTSSIASEIRNLNFRPSRRIVLEEFNGSECSNCPLGIRAIENIQSLYPGSLIPICVRTYYGDRLGVGMEAYSSFLGMIAAPSGRLNRGPIAMPMMSNDMDYMFSGAGFIDSYTGMEPELWLDLFRKELADPAELGLALESQLDEANNCVNVKAVVNSALNLERTAYNLFAVIVENNIETYQANGFSSVTDPDLGEWGKGGKYGMSTVYPVMAMDVARATWGNTFNGTGGLIPATIKAGESYSADIKINLPSTISNLDNCEVIVMLIDAGKERVVNANYCALNGKSADFSGIDEIISEAGDQIGIAVVGGALMVNGDNFSVEAYDLAGLPVVRAQGSGLHAYSLNGYKGILLVKATDANGNATTSKILVK